jgi:GNAT superfamily N-acetyltransferase
MAASDAATSSAEAKADAPAKPLQLPNFFSLPKKDGPEGEEEKYVLRGLEVDDFSKGYKELLNQLSDAGDLDQEKFSLVFERMQKVRGLVIGIKLILFRRIGIWVNTNFWGFSLEFCMVSVSDFLAEYIVRLQSPKQNSQAGTRVIVIEDLATNKLAGAATCLFEQKFNRGGAQVGHIEDVVVSSDYRRRGFASRIINQLVAEARERTGLDRVYKLILDCTEDNSAVYAKMGYFKTGEIQMRINAK